MEDYRGVLSIIIGTITSEHIKNSRFNNKNNEINALYGIEIEKIFKTKGGDFI